MQSLRDMELTGMGHLAWRNNHSLIPFLISKAGYIFHMNMLLHGSMKMSSVHTTSLFSDLSRLRKRGLIKMHLIIRINIKIHTGKLVIRTVIMQGMGISNCMSRIKIRFIFFVSDMNLF